MSKSCVDCVHHTIYECRFNFTQEDHKNYVEPILPKGLTPEQVDDFYNKYHAQDCRGYSNDYESHELDDELDIYDRLIL